MYIVLFVLNAILFTFNTLIMTSKNEMGKGITLMLSLPFSIIVLILSLLIVTGVLE